MLKAITTEEKSPLRVYPASKGFSSFFLVFRCLFEAVFRAEVSSTPRKRQPRIDYQTQRTKDEKHLLAGY